MPDVPNDTHPEPMEADVEMVDSADDHDVDASNPDENTKKSGKLQILVI